MHRPECNADKVPKHKIILQQLRDQIAESLFPLHRLDVATSGVLLFAKSSGSASEWNQVLRSAETQKKYQGIVRGFAPDSGCIEIPLKSDSSQELLPARTEFRCLRRVDLPLISHERYPSSRYSWVEFQIRTGRFHQIRRHMNRISHPLLGDSEHGDTRQNRFFRETLGVSGLCLHASEIVIPAKDLHILAPLPPKWNRVEQLFRNEIVFETDERFPKALKNPV